MPITTEMARGQFRYLYLVHKTTRSIVLEFPDDKLDWVPAPKARTPRQVIEHIYANVAAHAAHFDSGNMAKEDYVRFEDAPREGGAVALAAWADARFAEASMRVADAPDSAFAGTVQTPYGPFEAPVFLSIAYDEWWHHRGQLTVYLRLLGIDVPDIYAYDC